MSAIDSQLPSSSGQDRPTDEVDRILSPGKLIILGLQHVLVMYEPGEHPPEKGGYPDRELWSSP